MYISFFILLFISAIGHAAEKSKVTIDTNAPLVHEYTSYQTPPTPEIETDLFKQYNDNMSEARRSNLTNVTLTAMSATTAVLAFFIPDSPDTTGNTMKRATIMGAVLTAVTLGFKTCFDCRRKPKAVANYSRGTTPRHGYPVSISKGPSPVFVTRTLD